MGMKIEISNRAICYEVPFELARELRERLTFQHPQFIENEKMGRWNGDTPKLFECFSELGGGILSLPRSFTRHLLRLCRKHGIQPEVADHRRHLPWVDFEFSGHLRPFQMAAINDVLGRDNATLSAPTGSGKTVMALFMVARRGQPTLIIVQSKELLYQWVTRIGTFVGIPKDEIGIIGDGKRTVGQRITVALVQSLYKCADQIAPCIGFLVVDECHRAPSRTFTEALTSFDCKALSTLFLTTPILFDGRLIQYLGRVLRPAPGNDKAVVFNYIDSKVGVLRSATKSRRRVYGQ